MRVDVNIDLSLIDDDALTAVLARRYKGCGKNMPYTAAALRSIAGRLAAALDAPCVSPAWRASRRAFYRGDLAIRGCPRERSLCGGLVAFIQFRVGDDGRRLFLESLETAVVRAGTAEALLAGVFKTPPAAWIEGPSLTKRRDRRWN
jgi:hypothetical protein